MSNMNRRVLVYVCVCMCVYVSVCETGCVHWCVCERGSSEFVDVCIHVYVMKDQIGMFWCICVCMVYVCVSVRVCHE